MFRFMKLPILAFLIQTVTANVEKTIFLGPEPNTIPSKHPKLQDLRLDVLTPETASLRTHVQAQFPTDSDKYGTATWLLLDDLKPGQRYEVRICWAATQPTSFWLDTMELRTVWDTPDLIASLSAYSHSRQQQQPGEEEAASLHRREYDASVLLLRILAAADYFTTNATLMRDVPPVHADVILDPYLLNVLPRSLAPTAGYIIVVALVSWLIASRLVMPCIQSVIDDAAVERPRGEEGPVMRRPS